MSLDKVKELLQQLQHELKNTQQVDEATKQQIDQIDMQIDEMLAADSLHQKDIYDAVVDMEYDFVNNHPVASGIFQEIVDILSRVGI